MRKAILFACIFFLSALALFADAPIIQCPPDITIECDSLDAGTVDFGEAQCVLNCTDVKLELFQRIDTLDQCNVGTIRLIFIGVDTITNDTDRSTTIVTVISSNPFDGLDPTQLEWPDPFITIAGCNGVADTSVTGVPILHDNSCALVGATFEDEEYIFATSACSKVIRTWCVIDWCQYDPRAPNPRRPDNGYWTFEQIIKLIDTIDPIIQFDSLITIEDFSGSCGSRMVRIDSLEAGDNCTDTTELQWLVKVDFNQDGSFDLEFNGPDISHTYPVGTHLVKVFVEDRCGNQSFEKFLIRIIDRKAPNAVAIHGLSVNLVEMMDSAMIKVDARLFDASSTDNCYPPSSLRFSFSEDPTDTCRVYNCDSVGRNSVSWFVHDPDGNFSKVITTILVTDTDSLCTSGLRRAIGGNVHIVEGPHFKNLTVNISSPSYQKKISTNELGHFELDGLTAGKDYMIRPYNNNAPMAGISTIDLVLIQKHLLGIQTLDSPYKIIAADVNGSKTVSAQDISELRKLILGNYSQFPNQDSWCFIPENHQFANSASPFDFDGYIMVENMNADVMKNDFVAVKVGDINQSVQLAKEENIESRSISEIDVANNFIAKNEVTTIEFTLDESLDGFQFQLNFDPALMHYLNFESAAEHFNSSNIGLNQVREGKIKFSWNSSGDQAGPIKFELSFKSKSAGKVSEFFSLEKTNFVAEAYAQDLEISDLELNFNDVTPSSNLAVLHQNIPNPFMEQTTILFELPESMEANLLIYTSEGKELKEIESVFKKGYNTVIIDQDLFKNKTGIYYYRLQVGDQILSKKMVFAKK